MRSMILSCALALAALPAHSQSTHRSADALVAESAQQLASAGFARTRVSVTYDSRYRQLSYPGGDVADDRGVCTDVIIRAYRGIGIDLQQRVHEDMSQAFSTYPDIWGLTAPDPNIDHRRVPNLERFFERQGARLALPRHRRPDTARFLTGDIVTWRLANGAPHIGIVHSRRTPDGQRPLVIHNIGSGPVLDDSLFLHTLWGHYRYHPKVEPDTR